MCGCWAAAGQMPTDGKIRVDDFNGLFILLISKHLVHRLLNNMLYFIFLKKLNRESTQTLDFVTEQRAQGLQRYTRNKKRSSLRLVRAENAINL